MFAMTAATVRAQAGEGASSLEQLPGQTASQDQLLGARELKGGPHQVEGSWTLIVTSAVPEPPRSVYATFSRGGAFIGSDRNSPFAGPQHGTWAHTGGGKFAFTFIQDLFDVAAHFQGTLKVRAALTLTGEDEFVGVASGDLRDATGTLVVILCATVRGERITVEPLSPQCRGIEPSR